MNRQEFLEQKWIRYPTVPAGTVLFGRLHEVQQGSDWRVTLFRGEKKQTRQFQNLFLCDQPEMAIDRLLVVGDLVAISEQGAVTLLAPHLERLPGASPQFLYLKLWQDYLREVHNFFYERGFLHITTPYLVTCPGTEPTLDYFKTEFIRGQMRRSLYLPTSPEIHLKKALALGVEKAFEVKTCFRNGEVTDHHQPEFTMIEWYRSYEDLTAIKRDVVELVAHLSGRIRELKIPVGFESATLSDLFLRHCGFALKPQTTLEQLKELAAKLVIDVRSAEQIDDYFFLIFLARIESGLNPEKMTFVEKYPPYQAALARLTEEGWGDRFEIYWQGLEIANAFHELNDPKIQRQRFAEDLTKKRMMKKDEVPLDDEFLQCLDAGAPPAAGIALGLERLFMAMTGIKKISDSRLFPLK